MEITDEKLMAYADGELDPAEAQDIEARVAADPALADRLRLFTATRGAMAGLAPPPVPDALSARIRALAETTPAAANVVPLAPRRPVRWQMAAAASVALAIGLGAGIFAIPRNEAFGTVGDLAAALSSLPSGETADVAGGSLHVISTFHEADGTLCREFEHDGPDARRLTSVACRGDGTWDLRLAVAGGGAEGYAPVSSSDALEAWFAGTEAGPPLDPEAEAAALAGL